MQPPSLNLEARAEAAEMAAADDALSDAKTAAEAAVTAADAALKDTYVPADDQSAINTAKSNLATALDAANNLAPDAAAEQKNTAAKNIEDAVKALTEATENKLPAKSKVKPSNKKAIQAARKAYKALTKAQRKYVTKAIRKKLIAAEKALKRLK